MYTNQAKRLKTENEENIPMETDAPDVTNTSDLKTETSGYITDDERILSENDKSFSQESDESRNDSVLEGDGIDIENKTVQVGEIKITEKNEIQPNIEKVVRLQPAIQEEKEHVGDNTKSTNSVGAIKTNITYKSAEADDKIKLAAQSSKDPVKTIESETNLIDHQNESCVIETKQSETTEMKNEPNETEKTEVSIKPDGSEKKRIESDLMKNDSVVKPEMVEASTGTNIVSTASGKCNVQIPKQSSMTDDDISEPVVSSTQNTQGCQTEPPESSITDTIEIPHSSEVDITRSAVSPLYKSTVDVSCETDNFVLSRQMSFDSVSVSTETEVDNNESKSTSRKLVDCSTDVYDFPKSELDEKLTVDCSTDLEGFPADSTKRKALTVDCSTSIENLQTASSKRKSMDNESYIESMKNFKKSEAKACKRSYSYAGHLHTPKTAYLAQPLSPTKLKFTSPKSPVRSPPNTPAPKSPSRAEPSGFQSQYQSFVMELPENTYRFDEDDPPKPIKPVTLHKSGNNTTVSLPSSLKKPLSKSGRPRGRPPKNRPIDSLPPPKEKKHKSRSHSPKHRKNEKDKDRTCNLGAMDTIKVNNSVSSDSARTSTAYAWINKIDNGSKSPSERKVQKQKQESSCEKTPSDLRIPKQFLYFSNGQYTIATVSSLNTLKQSSPVSPPPKTVFTSDINIKTLSKISTTDIKNQNNSNTVHHVKHIGDKNTDKTESSEPKVEQFVDISRSIQQHEKQTKSQQKQKRLLDSDTSHKKDLNQNKIVRTQAENTKQTANVNDSETNADSNKDTNTDLSKDKPPVSVPEYRHQSPFFASISNAAKLQAPHRPTAHLNVPNLTSHFSGTHQLYSHGRYANERLGTPIYRSYSMNDKSSSPTMTSKFEEARRLEAIASASQCGYLAPFPAPYLGLMHSHLVSSLPPPPPLSKHGHFPEPTRSLSFSDNASSSTSLSQNAAKHLTKVNYSNPKGKEKSIDRIISAITEMRTKKETQEQLNGIDLSTKSSRQSGKSKELISEQKLDKFEFTDDDDTPGPHKKLCRQDHEASVSRKDAV